MSIEWKSPNDPPEPKSGGMVGCIVAVKGRYTNWVGSAWYLNSHPLEYRDGCGAEDCADNHEDGCPTTGWFTDNSTFDYDNCYWRIEGEILAWAPYPSFDFSTALSLTKEGGDHE